MSAQRAVVVAALCLACGGCAAGEDPADTVDFWAMGSEGEAVARLLPEFERRHPGLRVRVQRIPWSAAHEKLLTAFVGDAMPDVFQAGNTWLAELAAIGALAPLDEHLRHSADIAAADYFAGIWATNVIDAKLWGIPWYVDTRLLFYRTDLLRRAGFDAPPRSWEQWLHAMRAARATGAARHGIFVSLREWQLPVVLALQQGASLLRDGRHGNFRDPRFATAFDFYLRLFREGLAPVGGETQIANVYQDFAAGFFAFYMTGPWNLGELGRRMPAALEDSWSTAPMPSPGGDAAGVSLAGGASLALYSGSRRKAAAWKLIEYLSQPEQQIGLYRLTGDLPSRPSAWNDRLLADNSRAAAFRIQLQAVQSTPQVPEWERIAETIGRHAEAAIRGAVTADEALTRLDADVDRILEKRRWLLDRAARGDA